MFSSFLGQFSETIVDSIKCVLTKKRKFSKERLKISAAKRDSVLATEAARLPRYEIKKSFSTLLDKIYKKNFKVLFRILTEERSQK